MIDHVASHTIVGDLLSGGWVLDAGCRDFIFSEYATRRGCRVVSLDPDPSVVDPNIVGIYFRSVAMAAERGTCRFALTDDVEARHLASACSRGRDVPYVDVPVVTLSDLMKDFVVDVWDCVKLDIEGSEYGILADWPGPIARQITIEFHDHVEHRPEYVYDDIYRHLDQWYDAIVCTPGDSLFVLKELSAGLPRSEGEPWWRLPRDPNVPWWTA